MNSPFPHQKALKMLVTKVLHMLRVGREKPRVGTVENTEALCANSQDGDHVPCHLWNPSVGEGFHPKKLLRSLPVL